MDRWLKRKSSNEGEPAPKKTLQEIPSAEGSEGGGAGGRAGGSADSSDAVNETDPPDFQKAIKRKREADSAKNVMAKAIEDAHLQSAAEMKGLLKTAYFIAKNEIAKAKFCHVVKFLKEMECPAFKKLTETSSYGSYVNEKGLSEMQQAIASTLVEDVDKAVERSPVFSLKSTDIRNTKRLIIYVRFIDDNKVKTKLIRNSEIADGRADTIVEDFGKFIFLFLTSV
uniref:Uncharacterized protein n=1 Tax=Nothobranchius pienaari TaxID=704102 RepID=A0A1A8N1F7_9TELE